MKTSYHDTQGLLIHFTIRSLNQLWDWKGDGLSIRISVKLQSESPRGVVSNELDCDIRVRVQTPMMLLYSLSNKYSLEGMNSLIPFPMGLTVPLLFFNKDEFDIKWPTNVDMPLKKRNQTNKYTAWCIGPLYNK